MDDQVFSVCVEIVCSLGAFVVGKTKNSIKLRQHTFTII